MDAADAPPAGQTGRVREVAIRDDGIRLGQLLKLADVVDTGADVKTVLAAGAVRVNGEPETRRGRQLIRGDRVEVNGQSLLVT